jgi:predicted secreted protein
MSLLAAFAVYFVIWWTVLFCILPLDIRSQAEAGDVAHGTEPGAPVAPQLARKALITSAVALVVFAGVYVGWNYLDV